MPELPEVQHIASWLAPQLKGRVVKGVSVVGSGASCLPQGEALVNRRTRGRRMEGVSRRGKLIVLRLDGDDMLAVHLKMTGQLWVDRDPPHLRVRVQFECGRELQMADARKFGWLQYWTPGEFRHWEERVGPEPVPDLPEGWEENLHGRRSVKAMLLDQRVVAGIGNIYADEILFRSRLRPERRLESLSAGDRKRLRNAIVAEMTAAVDERHGEPDQKRIGGGDRSVKRLFDWAVFQREGERCKTCGTTITRTVVAQRGTYVCTKCQR